MLVTLAVLSASPPASAATRSVRRGALVPQHRSGACANCHIMRPQYDSWQKASHHAVARASTATCRIDFVRKYLAKAENGWRHSKGFTLQDFAEPIIDQRRRRRAILQENCLRCHGDLVHDQRRGRDDRPRRDAAACTATRGVGHGERAGLGGPLTAARRRRTESEPMTMNAEPRARGRGAGWSCSCVIVARGRVTAGVDGAAHQHLRAQGGGSARPYVRLVEVGEDDTDPAKWGKNWPRAVRRLPAHRACRRKTRFGGHGGSEALPEEKIERDPVAQAHVPRLRVLDRLPRPARPRLHARRPGGDRSGSTKPQSGSCLHCHASVMPLYRELGGGDAMKGFEETFKLTLPGAEREAPRDRATRTR